LCLEPEKRNLSNFCLCKDGFYQENSQCIGKNIFLNKEWKKKIEKNVCKLIIIKNNLIEIKYYILECPVGCATCLND
jgi:hypothetical protein